MNEQFSPDPDHRMNELEHLRSETTMMSMPTLPTSPSRPGEVPAALVPDSAPAPTKQATAPSPPPQEPTPVIASPTAERQLSVQVVAAACLGCLVVFGSFYLLAQYVLL